MATTVKYDIAAIKDEARQLVKKDWLTVNSQFMLCANTFLGVTGFV